jgi:hypothetical protein
MAGPHICGHNLLEWSPLGALLMLLLNISLGYKRLTKHQEYYMTEFMKPFLGLVQGLTCEARTYSCGAP